MDMREEVEKFLLERLKGEYYEKFQYSYDSGRKIRPLMMQKICERFGKDFGNLSTAAACVEIVHCASLMHDDIIDQDDERRGKPSFHKKFGLREGVLYGDYFATLSWELASEHYPKPIQLAFIRTMREVIEGQIMEVKGVNTIEEYLEYIRKKTSSLFYLSAAIPALMFDIKNKNIQIFGREFGIAFQIANDLKKKAKEQFTILKFMSRKEAEKFLRDKITYIDSLNIVNTKTLGF
ncbi:MAG: polyprenyl synthetase family protein [Candidatus Aenigmatarchaeota archaeon]